MGKKLGVWAMFGVALVLAGCGGGSASLTPEQNAQADTMEKSFAMISQTTEKWINEAPKASGADKTKIDAALPQVKDALAKAKTAVEALRKNDGVSFDDKVKNAQAAVQNLTTTLGQVDQGSALKGFGL